MKNRLVLTCVACVSLVVAQRSIGAQTIDWKAIGDEAITLLQEYVRIDTSNPPGDTRKAADFLAAIFERDGIPVTRYESAPGKAIVYARLKATTSPATASTCRMRHPSDQGRVQQSSARR